MSLVHNIWLDCTTGFTLLFKLAPAELFAFVLKSSPLVTHRASTLTFKIHLLLMIETRLTMTR